MKVQPVGKPQEVFRGKVYKIFEQKVRQPDGTESVHEFVQKPAGVIVIAMDKDDSIVLVQEKRVVPQRLTTPQQFMRGKGREKEVKEEPQWALPGGLVEAGESPEEAAARELLEETGLKGQIEFFARRPAAPRTIWDLRVFIAAKLKQTGEAKDNLEVKKVPLMEAVHLAFEDAIENDYAALSLIQFALRNNRIEVLPKEVDPRLL